MNCLGASCNENARFLSTVGEEKRFLEGRIWEEVMEDQGDLAEALWKDLEVMYELLH